jgi:hypothetical protein
MAAVLIGPTIKTNNNRQQVPRFITTHFHSTGPMHSVVKLGLAKITVTVRRERASVAGGSAQGEQVVPENRCVNVVRDKFMWVTSSDGTVRTSLHISQ